MCGMVWSHSGLEAKNAKLPAMQKIGVRTKDCSSQSSSSSPPGLASANAHPWLSFLLLVDFLPQWKDGCFCRCGLPPDALTTNSTS